MKENKGKYVLLLFTCAMLWGSTYPATKYAVGFFTPAQIITIRFTLASAILIFLIRDKFFSQNKEKYIKGIKVGVILFFGYFLSQTGAQYTEASKQAFLTGIYVVLVPFMFFLFERKKPVIKEIISAVLCLIGLTIISGFKDFSHINQGDLWTLGSSVFYAYYVYTVGAKLIDEDPMFMSAMQMLTVTCLSAIVWFFNPAPLPKGIEHYGIILYLSLACTLMAIPMQNISQRHLSANVSAVILSFETVFGGVLGILILNEPVTINLITGALLCFTGIVIANLPKREVIEKRKGEL